MGVNSRSAACSDHAGLCCTGSYYNGNSLPYSTPGAYYTPSGMTPISTASYSFQSVSGGEPKNHLG